MTKLICYKLLLILLSHNIHSRPDYFFKYFKTFKMYLKYVIWVLILWNC